MHHRYYDPQLGHFLNPDFRAPDIYDPTTFTEPYAYAAGNPMMFWDPDGLRVGHGDLTQEQQEKVLSELSKITGYNREALAFIGGELRILDETKYSGGSVNSRTFLKIFIKDPRVVTFVSSNTDLRKIGTLLGAAVKPEDERFRKYLTIDLDDFSSGEGLQYTLTSAGRELQKATGRNIEEELRHSFSIGTVIFHELLHSFYGLDDPKEQDQNLLTGPVVDLVNNIRKDFKIPLRDNYHLAPLVDDSSSADFGKGDIRFSINGVTVGKVTLSVRHLAPFRLMETFEEIVNNPHNPQELRDRVSERLSELEIELDPILKR